MSEHKLKAASVEDLLSQYKEAATAYNRALEAGTSRAANRAADQIMGVYRELRRREATAQLLPLLESEDENLRSFAAAHALEFAPERGAPILEELASRVGPQQVPAKYALREWRAGKLKFP